MIQLNQHPLREDWKNQLGLTYRQPPEYFEPHELIHDTPHAAAIRTALTTLGISGVFCVQGVPTVAFLSMDHYDSNTVLDVHGALWNQGLASLLIVITGPTLRAFSLARKPYRHLDTDFRSHYLVTEFDIIADGLEIKNLIQSVESGRLWKEYPDYFNPQERVDHVLLDNLITAHDSLCNAKLSSDAAQALLLQTVFVSYLEDRGILTSLYFFKASNRTHDTFLSLLEARDTKAFHALFRDLREHFNGDLFFAPLSFDSISTYPELRRRHLEILSRFRSGREDMKTGQRHFIFWGYDFRYIPVELISAVYDHFLGEHENAREEQGAYYTPMFLADTVVTQLWDHLSERSRVDGRYLDPSCGSGVFLVRLFQRLCEHWKARENKSTIPWVSLLSLLRRLHGWDLNGDAVRVAVFSLYIALMEEITPPDIERLLSKGRLLPKLLGRNLLCTDFFDPGHDRKRFELIVGNPPWRSRYGADNPALKWCNDNGRPAPGGEIAWAFAWKSLTHLTGSGLIALLLPAMGFLHNHAKKAVDARIQLLKSCRVQRIVNFSDLRFQLFEHAVRPTALVIFGHNERQGELYRFEYLVPKSDPNLRTKRVISINSIDYSSLLSADILDNPQLFKERMWMKEPDVKLFRYLSRLPKLGDLVRSSKINRNSREQEREAWTTGLGFKVASDEVPGGKSTRRGESEYVGAIPYLPIGSFRRLAQPLFGLEPWPTKSVHRAGYEDGYRGVRVLVPRGVDTVSMRLRATYTEDPLTFQQIIQAIKVPPSDRGRAKLLTGILNSRVALWFAFHGMASFGADRPAISQADLLNVPFPSVRDLPDEKKAIKAEKALVHLVDGAMKLARNESVFGFEEGVDRIFDEIDNYSYDFFCLSKDERIIIDDAVESIMPSVQPHAGTWPAIWNPPTLRERTAYARKLLRCLRDWFDPKSRMGAELVHLSPDVGVLRLELNRGANSPEYFEAPSDLLDDAISRVLEHIPESLGRNFQLLPDLRVFLGDSLYLLKPMQRRYWLESTALADSDSVALDLHDAQVTGNRQG